MKNYFISYNHHDEAWAKWIDWTLRAEGYDTIVQAYDFPVGSNFVSNMDDALKEANHVLCVLTQQFLDSNWCKEEWTSAIDRLIPVRVADIKPNGLLEKRIYIDLFDLPEDKASEKLLAEIQEKARPVTKPPFPENKSEPLAAGENKPAFPGVPHPSESRNMLMIMMVFAITVIALSVVLAVALRNPDGSQSTNGAESDSIVKDGETVILGLANTGEGNQFYISGNIYVYTLSAKSQRL